MGFNPSLPFKRQEKRPTPIIFKFTLILSETSCDMLLKGLRRAMLKWQPVNVDRLPIIDRLSFRTGLT